MDYHKDTQNLIDRMCLQNEREDFTLEKEKAEYCLLKTYDLFNLPRPKKIIWVKDIFDKKFYEVARSASSARSCLSVLSSWSARSASLALLASLAPSALDYDFDWYVFEFEYIKNPNKDCPLNENDYKYLEYCELLMEAKEYGLGYRVEWEDTLYLAPTPIVKIDDEQRWHSENSPAIYWKEGKEFYYLNGILFDKQLWQKVLSEQMTFSEILDIENTEQRLIAMRYNPHALALENPKLIKKTDRGNELLLIENSKVNEIYDEPKVYLLGFTDPSKKDGRNKMYEEVNPELVKATDDPDTIQAFHLYSGDNENMDKETLANYLNIYQNIIET